MSFTITTRLGRKSSDRNRVSWRIRTYRRLARKLKAQGRADLADNYIYMADKLASKSLASPEKA